MGAPNFFKYIKAIGFSPSDKLVFGRRWIESEKVECEAATFADNPSNEEDSLYFTAFNPKNADIFACKT